MAENSVSIADATGEAPVKATFMGAPPDQGRIIVGTQFPGEGYAVIRCGNTEVQVSYTVLRGLHIDASPLSSQFRDMGDLQEALHSIACEASLGRTGDGEWRPVDMPEPERVAVIKCQPYTGPVHIKGVIE